MGSDNSNNTGGPKNPWGDKGGAKGGKNGGNPWGNGGANGGGNQGGNRGGGQQPPDMDEMLRKMQENFQGFIPPNFKGGKLIVLGVALIGLLWVASGIYFVQPGEHAVIQRFGAWERTKTDEGPGFHFPFPVESRSIVKVNEIRRMNIGFAERNARSGSQIVDVPEESLMLTSDRNIIDLDMVIQWNIKSANDFLFEIEDQESTLKKVTESAIREVVGQTRMFPIITRDRAIVAERTKQIIQTNLDAYNSGVNVTQVLIQQAEVHPDVQAAFQDVQSAKQDADDVQNRAQAYREDIIPRARGEAIKLKQQAEAYKQSVIARATGDADLFTALT